MNIVLSAKSFIPNFGGTINYSRMLARSFQEAGHEVTVITRTLGPADSVDGMRVLRCPTFGEKWKLAKEADVLLQVESSWQDALPFLLCGVRWFPTLHRGYPTVPISQVKAWLKLQLERIAYHLGQTIGVSHYALASWNIRGECIGSSYEDEQYTPPAHDSLRDIELFFIGRMTYDKGALVMMEAIEQIMSAEPGLLKRVRFAGTGPALEELRQRCSALQDRLDIQALGAVEGNQAVIDHLRRSKILVFPTTSKWLEASPIVPLEGLACGCYVVASDIGGTRENIGPKGFLVTPDDVGGLAATLTKVLKEQPAFDLAEVAEFLSNRGVKATAARYLELFENALAKR